MKSIRDLKNPDIITINNEKFQVIENTSLWYHTDKKELEMAVELIKVAQPQITPDFRLAYIYERPEEMKFLAYNKNKGVFEEVSMDSYHF